MFLHAVICSSLKYMYNSEQKALVSVEVFNLPMLKGSIHGVNRLVTHSYSIFPMYFSSSLYTYVYWDHYGYAFNKTSYPSGQMDLHKLEIN